ncbi:MAG: MFS transporter [Paracoccaceae bacterium]|nr:MFS transporter [Paracoccaceae bacterium]
MQDSALGQAAARSTPRLAAAGFLATAISFGPARMGFGLFLPEFRESFALTTTAAGLVASGGFLAFLLALPVAAALDARHGPRVPVLAGAAAAVAGFALVAAAPGSALLATGVAVAGASAGLCWTPFNDAAERTVPQDVRPGTLSAISTGTTLGVAGAGALALAVGLGALPWRVTWGLFAAAGLVAAAVAAHAVPGGHRPAPRGDDAPAFLRRETAPLYGASLVFGASNAVYLSFAADRIAQAGGLPGPLSASAPAAIFLGYGLFGLVGLATGRMEARLGLRPLLAGIFAAFATSLALIGLWPGSWPGVIASAGLHGAAVMTVSATLSIWTLRLFPGRGSQGFTAALIVVAAGSAAAPVLAGPALGALGPRAAFLGFALPATLAALAFAVEGATREWSGESGGALQR